MPKNTNFWLKCLECGESHPATVRVLTCPECGGLFDIEYPATPAGSAQRLPLNNPDAMVTLGEGSTPLIELRRTGRQLGLGGLYAKLEFVSATGSFKDRGSAVLVSAAVEENVTEFVEDSSGNAGASLSAYAAAAGIKAHVFAPASAAKGKLDQIAIFGSDLRTVAGPRQAATDAAKKFLDDHNLVYLSHNYSAYFAEGMKAVSYELVSDLGDEVDHVVLPVGNGSLLIGLKKGYDELLSAGRIGSVPRLTAAQAAAIRPVVAAVNGERWGHLKPPKQTVASGISVAQPPRLAEQVSAVHDTAGFAVAVQEKAIIDWRDRLARDEGLYCEATSAVAFAGVENLVAAGRIKPGDTVVVPVTGSGLKEPA